jgi:hypothetical protein
MKDIPIKTPSNIFAMGLAQQTLKENLISSISRPSILRRLLLALAVASASLHLAAQPASEPIRLGLGVAVGLAAASIGALFTVFARWGIAQGLQAPDLTVLRFGVAGLITLLVLVWLRGAMLWAWAFVIEGTLDTINAGPQFILAIHDQTLVGALGWLILTIYVPALIVTEIVLVWLLLRSHRIAHTAARVLG